jgi:hypothetical protein
MESLTVGFAFYSRRREGKVRVEFLLPVDNRRDALKVSYTVHLEATISSKDHIDGQVFLPNAFSISLDKPA